MNPMDTYQSSGATLVFLVFHVALAVSLWKMASRVHEEPKWFALVPVLNIVLFLKLAKRPLWWLILLLIPVVNFVTLVAAAMPLCERFGLNKWWALAMLISPLNIILLLYLAFGTEGAGSAPKAPPTTPAAT